MAEIPADTHITYQRQYRKCGKPSCGTCREGNGHGPYWYAYWRKDGKLHSTYIGKNLPAGVQAEREGTDNNNETTAVVSTPHSSERQN